MLKLSQKHYPTQDIITDLSMLNYGDLIQVIKIKPIVPLAEGYYNPGEKPTILMAKNVIVNNVSSNVIFGWVGTGANITREQSFDKAIAKYQNFLNTGTPAATRVVAFEPNTIRILRVGNVEELDLTPERQIPLTTEPWFGLGEKAGIWHPIKTSSNSVINEALQGEVVGDDIVYREVKFHYTRKLKRHYPAPNTATDRYVRPHFMYTISTKPGNEYLLARDYLKANGEWRSFLIVDQGMMRIQNAALGEPFKFDVKQTMLYVKKGMKNIAKRLLDESESKEEYKMKKSEHNLYNTLKSYYKHIRKLLKEDSDDDNVKECCSYNKNFTFGDYISVDYINGNSANYVFSHWGNGKLYGWEDKSGFRKSASITQELADISTIKDINKIGTIFS